MRFTPNLVIGLVLTTVGVVLTAERLDMVDARQVLRYWPVVLILFGASVVAQAFQRGESTPGTRPPRPFIGPGLVLMLVVVGLALSNGYQRVQGRRVETGAGNTRVFALMGRDSREIEARFRGADMTSVMGRSRLDLRDASLAPGEEAVVDVFGMMGQVEIVVPEHWVVDVQATPVMGAVKDQRWSAGRPRRAGGLPPDDRAGDSGPDRSAVPPRVIVRGFIMMGALLVTS